MENLVWSIDVFFSNCGSFYSWCEVPEALPEGDIDLTNQTEMRDDKNITSVSTYITLKVWVCVSKWSVEQHNAHISCIYL